MAFIAFDRLDQEGVEFFGSGASVLREQIERVADGTGVVVVSDVLSSEKVSPSHLSPTKGGEHPDPPWPMPGDDYGMLVSRGGGQF